MVKKNDLLAFFFFFSCTCFITYPLIFHLKTYSFGLGDELLIAWIIKWVSYIVVNSPLELFHAPIYYPYQNTLAYSDTHVVSALLMLIPSFVVQEPIALYNLSVILSFSLMGFCTYLLVKNLTLSYEAGYISGILAGYNSFILTKTMHLQIISIFWIPISLLCFIYFIQTGGKKWAILCMVFFYMQTINSFLPGYFLLFCYGILLFSKKRKSLRFLFLNKFIISILVLTTILLLPFIIPYLNVSQEFNYTRDIREAIHNANRPEYFLYASGVSNLQPLLFTLFYRNNTGPYFYDGYIGFSLLFFSIGIILFSIVREEIRRIPYYLKFLFIGIGAFILSLGPAVQWGGKVIKFPFLIPLPYALFYYILPGFKGMRNSGRWEMLTVFCLAVGVGLVLGKLFEKKSVVTRMITTTIIIFITLLEFNYPYTFFVLPQVKDFPPVYTFIRSLPESSVLIELPWYNWDMLPYSHKEHERMYFGTIHFKKMVNGGSGFSPPPWQQKARWFYKEFPNISSIEYLKTIGVTHMIVHNKEFDLLVTNKYFYNDWFPKSSEFIEENLQKNPDIRKIYQSNGDIVYEIL